MLDQWMAHWTYLGIFVVLLLGGLGLPLPEEAAVVTAGVLAHQHVIRWWIAVPVCLVGVLAGDILLYWGGREWGPRLLRLPLVRRVLSPERVAPYLRAYRRRGARVIFGARHVMGVRAIAFVAAGMAHVPFWRFLGADVVAAVPGVVTGFGLAYVFSDQVERLLADVRRVEAWLVVAAVLLVAGWWLWTTWRRRPS